MKLEVTDVIWLDERVEYSLLELAESSRLPEALLRELIDCGALQLRDPLSGGQSFGGAALVAARTARRLRDDFDLDAGGVALALALLRRIGQLEDEVRRLRAGAAPLA